jgi:hypothetical protein
MYTKEFIEKVSKAKEIQKLWLDRIKNGEYRTDYVYYYDPNNKEYKVELFLGIRKFNNGEIKHNLTIDPKNSYYSYVGCSWQKDISKYYWLPTLEQLFGIIKSPFSIAYTLSRVGQEKINAKDIKEKVLEILMEKEYNKQWNPDIRVWININAKETGEVIK